MDKEVYMENVVHIYCFLFIVFELLLKTEDNDGDYDIIY